jgi:hypothetical protein
MEHPPSEAEFAVLDAALDEELDGLAPPDLWPRLQAALAGGTAANARPRSRRPLWFALAMVAASAVVVAVWLDRGGNGTGSPDRVRALPAWRFPPPDVDADGPADLAQLQQWLADGGLHDATIDAESVFAPVLNRSVPMATAPFEGLFDGVLTVHLRFADREDLAAALQRAVPAPLAVGQRQWEHVVGLALGKVTGPRSSWQRNVRLLIRGDADGALRFAIATPHGAAGTAIDGIAALLEPELREVTAATIAARGIAIGDDGFDALPWTETRLRLHDVSRAAAARIGRFAALRTLDLRDAPDWHEARVVRALAALPLQELLLDGTRLDAEGIAALGTFTQLRKLFVLGPGDLLAQTFVPTPPVLPGRIVAAVAQLSQLEELLLVDGGLTDADLVQLAPLPGLRRLGLAAGAQLDGGGLRAFTGRRLRSLGLGSTRALDLAPLAGWRELEQLSVKGPLTAASLTAIRAIPTLKSLTLLPVPALTADDLPALYGATQLQRLEVFSADALDENARAALRAALPACRVSFESRP